MTTPLLVPRSVIRGAIATFDQLFVEADGTPLTPIDPAIYPSVSIIDPTEEVYQTGHATYMGDGRWRYVWNCPADAPLSDNGMTWRLDWVMVTGGSQQVQLGQNFDVIDRIESDPSERSYIQICLNEGTERLIVKFREPQETVTLFLKGGDVTPVNLSSRIVHVQQDGFHVYYADTDALSYGCFLATWRCRQSALSPWKVYVQQIRVPEDIFWNTQPNLRMMIDKVQKKDGHVQSYSDADMYFYLQSGAEIVNGVLPMTGWQLNSFPMSYGMGIYLVAASAWVGLMAQSIAETELAFCFSGDTWILTSTGLKQIKNLVGDLPPGFHDLQIEIMTPEGPRFTSKVYVSEDVRTLTVKTEHGYELTCTPNEPLLVLTPDLDLKWVTIEELKIEDTVAIFRDKVSITKQQECCDFSNRAKSEHYVTAWSPSKVPNELTPELARLLGYLVAEGSCKSNDTFEFCNCSDELLLDYSKCVEFVFGKIPKPNGSLITKAGKNLRYLRVSSVIARKILYYLGLNYVGSNLKEIPWSIMESSDKIAIEFLKAFFAGDGSSCLASTNKGYKTGFGSFCSSSDKLLKQIQILLLRLGCVSNLKIYKTLCGDDELSMLLTAVGEHILKEGYSKNNEIFKKYKILSNALNDEGYQIGLNKVTGQLHLRGPSWDFYIKNIGFCDSRKEKIALDNQAAYRFSQWEALPSFVRVYLNEITSRYKHTGTSKGYYKCIDGDLRRLCLSLRYGTTIDPSSYNIQYDHIQQYIDNCGDSISLVDPSLLYRLQRLLKYNFQFEKIVSIEEAGNQVTYDVCLDNTQDDLPHALIANGFVAHNTYSGQTTTLDINREAGYSAAADKLMTFIKENLHIVKENMLRRSSVGAGASRSYDFGLSSLVAKVQTVNAGQNSVLPLLSRLGFI